MIQIHTADAARDFVYDVRSRSKTLGIVPTMGALHEGHLSLCRASTKACHKTVATIFVNPTQFAPDEDLDKYPRTLDADCELLEAAGVDAVFVPSVETMYPPGFSTYVAPPKVAETLEGEFRPEHFRGVTTIVMKLFQLLPATHAFFGQKDYQQFKVIQAMVRDLNVGIDIIGCETVRESDGLALSSRNRYLDSDQRQRALSLSRALQQACESIDRGESDVQTLQAQLRDELLGANGVDSVDYAVIVDAESLGPLQAICGPAVALIAAHLGSTRLIDNRVLNLVGTEN